MPMDMLIYGLRVWPYAHYSPPAMLMIMDASGTQSAPRDPIDRIINRLAP